MKMLTPLPPVSVNLHYLSNVFVKFRPAHKLLGQKLELSPTAVRLLSVEGDFGAENHKILFIILQKIWTNLLSF